MKTHGLKLVVASLALAAAIGDAAPGADPQVPADVVAMLKEHRGKWHADGQWITHGKSEPTSATWECKAAAGGIGNVCTWHDVWADHTQSALEVMGYDSKLKTMSITRVMDDGFIRTVTPTVKGNTMVVRWTSTEDGKTSVGFNEVVVKSPGHWEQHMTIDVDGKRVNEMRVTHTRVASN